jgi:protein ImuA
MPVKRASFLSALPPALQARAAVRADAAARAPTGAVRLDAALGGGLARGRVHEFYADDARDGAAAAGFAALLGARFAGDEARPLLWLREEAGARRGGVVHAPGWADLGLDIGNWLFLIAADPAALLRAGVDALRCAGLGAVVIEGWGAWAKLDLTASRRFALAAERSGVPLLFVRIAAPPVPSAAETRWAVASAPSVPGDANAPGPPAFEVELLRQRAGPAGGRWQVEWDSEQKAFRDADIGIASETTNRPPDIGAPLPLSQRRPAQGAGTNVLRRVA